MREHSAGADNLRTPLVASREAMLRDDPADRLFRLWFCGEEFELDGFEAGFARQALDCGLLVRTGDRVAAAFHLRLVRGLLVFSDYLDLQSGEGVMGAGETTAVLYQAARPLGRVRRVLDLGCGAGTLALLLAADSEFVTGTDINPRAIALARFNAAVNKLENVEFRTGSLYEPVAGEMFDCIVSQPPYYPLGTGAEAEQVFLHGGERGDELANQVLAGVPRHLAAGGQATVFASWPEEVEPPHPGAMQCLELTTNRRELHGAKQSLNVYRHAPDAGFVARRMIPADLWGSVDAAEIQAIYDAEAMAQLSDGELAQRKFALAPGVRLFSEGAQQLLTGPGIGHVPLFGERWETLSGALADPSSDPDELRRALRDRLIAAIG